MRTFCVHTFGCKANQYDGQLLGEVLARGGFERACDFHGADVVVVNGCCVTSRACAKTRKFIHTVIRHNPNARIVVTGCYARMPRLDGEALSSECAIAPRIEDVARALGLPAPSFEQDSIQSFRGRHRAFIKIQEGCNATCAYCIVPRVRGRSRSRPVDTVCREAVGLARSGFSEIVLAGTHVGMYGRDLDKKVSLAQLARHIRDSGVEARLRLSSVEVNEVTPDLVALINEGLLCPHLHIPLQSGSVEVLRRMNRPYTPSQFLARLDEIRCTVLEVVITTDVLVGFPGETDEDFAATVALARRARFGKMHIFPFSARDGTEAADMPDKVPAPVIARRKKRLAEVEDELARTVMLTLVGRNAHVLVERIDESTGCGVGTTEHYFKATVAASNLRAGEVVRVSLDEVAGRSFIATATDGPTA